jgi:exonuclease III
MEAEVGENMPPAEPSEERPSQLGRRLTRYGACALAALSFCEGAIVGYWEDSQQDSGRYVLHQPAVSQPLPLSNEVKIINWNIESESANPTKDLKTIYQTVHPEFFLGQEVLAKESRKMMKIFRGYSQVFGVGKSTLGGQAFGNVLMSEGRINSDTIRSWSIGGTSLMATEARMDFGFLKDASNMLVSAAVEAGHNVDSSLAPGTKINESFDNTKNGLQESRDLEGVTFKVEDGNRTIDAFIATTHTAGAKIVHQQQLDRVVKIMGENTKPGQLTIICGDFNVKPEQKIRVAFDKDGFTTPPKQGLHTASNGDYCSYAAPGIAGVKVTVTALNLPGKRQHRPLEMDIQLPAPDYIAPIFPSAQSSTLAQRYTVKH